MSRRYQYGQVAALQQIANNGPLILRGGQGGNGFLQRVDVGFVLRTEKHGPFAFRCLRRSAEQVAFVVGYQKGDPLLPEQGDQFFICVGFSDGSIHHQNRHISLVQHLLCFLHTQCAQGALVIDARRVDDQYWPHGQQFHGFLHRIGGGARHSRHHSQILAGHGVD